MILFAFYAASYAVVIFFNTALISCANAYLNGKDMSVGEGLANASRHLPSVLAWEFISATDGIILHIIERRAGIARADCNLSYQYRLEPCNLLCCSGPHTRE